MRDGDAAPTPRFGHLAVQHGVQQRSDFVLGHPAEHQPSAAGQLHVHQRLADTEADAADIDDVGFELLVVQVAPDRRERRRGPGPSPQVPAPTKIAGWVTQSRRSGPAARPRRTARVFRCRSVPVPVGVLRLLNRQAQQFWKLRSLDGLRQLGFVIVGGSFAIVLRILGIFLVVTLAWNCR